MIVHAILRSVRDFLFFLHIFNKNPFSLSFSLCSNNKNITIRRGQICFHSRSFPLARLRILDTYIIGSTIIENISGVSIESRCSVRWEKSSLFIPCWIVFDFENRQESRDLFRVLSYRKVLVIAGSLYLIPTLPLRVRLRHMAKTCRVRAEIKRYLSASNNNLCSSIITRSRVPFRQV